MLNEDRGPVLDDDEFFHTLQNSKKTSQVVKESLDIAEITEIDINMIREGIFQNFPGFLISLISQLFQTEYRPSANLASILYFVLRDLSNVDPMYQFSLNFYNSLFIQSIENSEKNSELVQRIQNINDFHILNFYRLVRNKRIII